MIHDVVVKEDSENKNLYKMNMWFKQQEKLSRKQHLLIIIIQETKPKSKLGKTFDIPPHTTTEKLWFIYILMFPWVVI